MSSAYIGADLRRLVTSRADRLCEYCLVHEDDTFLGCEVDHVISLKHGGETSPDNLALACFFCNRHKGTDVGSVLPDGGGFVRLYNPRTDPWAEHFALSKEGFVIEPRTGIAIVTARLLGLNAVERRLEREVLHEVGRYPLPSALKRILGSV